jgi:Flp pilus assembly protein TadG
MFTEMTRKYRDYLRHERGIAAIILALSLPMLVAASGVAVDLSTAYNAQSRLSNALDKAILAAGSSSSLDPADLQTRFQAFFYANYPSGVYGTPTTPILTVNGNTMTASVTAAVPTSFMSIVGISSLTVSASSQSVLTLAGVEAVLVLDTTGSMAGNNIAALKLASTDFLNIMFASITNTQYLKVGIVPWSETVNVGPYGIGQNPDGSQFENGTTFVSPPATDPYVTPASSIVYGAGSTDWGGCVIEPNAASITEDNSSPNWQMFRYQHFTPTATSCTSYNCLGYACEAYACQAYGCATCSRGHPSGAGCTSGGTCVTPGTAANGASCTTPGTAANGASCTTPGTAANGASCATPGTTCLGWSQGDLPNTGCTSVPVLPLTSDQSALQAEINALPTANNTYPDIGMVWGWRLISPSFPFTEGASYSDNTWSKTVIMMTDGNATINAVASGEGYYGVTPGISQTTTDQNNSFEQICTNMKAQGIRIYTITFQAAINDTTRGFYSQCATNTSMYYDAPTNASLTTAFQQIATQLSQLHLTQ